MGLRRTGLFARSTGFMWCMRLGNLMPSDPVCSEVEAALERWARSRRYAVTYLAPSSVEALETIEAVAQAFVDGRLSTPNEPTEGGPVESIPQTVERPPPTEPTDEEARWWCFSHDAKAWTNYNTGEMTCDMEGRPLHQEPHDFGKVYIITAGRVPTEPTDRMVGRVAAALIGWGVAIHEAEAAARFVLDEIGRAGRVQTEEAP